MDDHANAATASTGTPTIARTPRLSILHLMVWMLCSSVYLALFRSLSALQSFSESFQVTQGVTSVMHGIVQGAALTGAIVLGYTRYRFGPPLLSYPGHWLLLVPSVLSILYLPIFLIFNMSTEVYIVTVCTVNLAQLVAYFLAARQTKLLRWRILFCTIIFFGLLECTSYAGFYLLLLRPSSWTIWLLYISPYDPLVIGILALVTAGLDLAARQPRDGFHWIGVITYLASMAVQSFWIIGFWFLQR